ncbi:Creatinine amidohydrolase [Saccharolobus shibatae B12]|uniref:Creatinine amidohydrolase n=1 Tax=Saccharolobus shibatae (strain ATCC 51178 / DSM 5389 / JCM 8931 / NBRC 15437 / B12) TaxID=523848 RepID=A0A8F5BM66_SACSH|nr:creatininase family protein [Saccharolobus shibatae]QXJ27759.1 Creatinine amidohydrolase [Saccharolobus shibatae B12]
MKLIEIARDEIREDLVGLVPVGSIEQHGPHLPMGTDSIISEYVASKAEEKLKEITLLFPTIYYGVSLEHKGFPFVSLSFQTAISLFNDLLESIFKDLGLRRIIIVNSHGGNSYFLPLVQREFNMKHNDAKVMIFNTFSEEEKLRFNVNDLHAGTVETSKIYAIDKRIVRLNKIEEIKSYDVREGVFVYYSTQEANQFGVLNDGKPIRIDEELGKKILADTVDKLIWLILNFKV